MLQDLVFTALKPGMMGHTDATIHSRSSATSTLRPCQPTLPPKFLLTATPRVCVCVCVSVVQARHSCNSSVNLCGVCVCAALCKTDKRLGGHGKGRGKLCAHCLCRLVTMSNYYLSNVCVCGLLCVVGGWGVGVTTVASSCI